MEKTLQEFVIAKTKEMMAAEQSGRPKKPENTSKS